MSKNFNFQGERYPEYFKTAHWRKLKEQLIYSNFRAKCYICEKSNTLLIHHVSYENLFKERLGRDIFIVCFNCHKQIHFKKYLFLFTRKTKLETTELIRRMRYLRYNYCIHKKDFKTTFMAYIHYILS